MRKKLIIIGPLAILGIMVFVGLGGAIVMLLWNGLTPSLFGWPEITFWQALGLLVLCRILFGGFGSRISGRSNIRQRISERIARRMADRMGDMSPEERERFRQRIRERWGCDPPTTARNGE